MAAIRQMQASMLKAGGGSEFLARSHLFLSSSAGLYRNKYWPESMEADVLIFDFQDGCPPGERGNVFKGLQRGHEVFPNKPFSVRLTELERDNDIDDGGCAIKSEIKACLEQKQVRWLMLPMCDNKDDVQKYIDIVKSIDRNWFEAHGALQILVETPLGLHNLDDILETHPEVQGVVVGAGDYFRFVQGSKDACLPMLRWDILNACLRHQRFPIDAPTFNINLTSVLSQYIKGVKDAGFKSATLLHPIQSRTANELLSESEAAAQDHFKKAREWNSGRETGYKRGTGDDFVGPPNAKLSKWLAHYSANTSTKRTFFIKEVNPEDLKRTRAFLCDLVSEQDTANPSSHAIKYTPNGDKVQDKWTSVILLAIVTTNHTRHKDILCNLGFTNACYHSTSSDACLENGGVAPSAHEKDAKYVAASLVSRRVTSAGDRVIAGYDCEVMNENYAPIFSVRMFLMEKMIPFETFNKRVDFHASPAEMEKRADITQAKKLATTAAKDSNDNIETFKSPGLKLHSEYCKYLGLDAPLHHTTSVPPTVPSTLHLTCHRLPWHGVTKVRDVCFHSPMKPDHPYTRSATLIDNQTYLSLVKDKTNGKLMSSVIYEYDEDIGNQVLLHQETEAESNGEKFIDNPKEKDEKRSLFSAFACCFSKNRNDAVASGKGVPSTKAEKIDGKKRLNRRMIRNSDSAFTPSLVELSDEGSFASHYSA